MMGLSAYVQIMIDQGYEASYISQVLGITTDCVLLIIALLLAGGG